MDNTTKLKCIVCGEVFEVTSHTEEVKCPKCGRTFPYDRATKYFKTFEKLAKEEKKVALGEMYLKVDSLLTEGDFYLENDDFENAEKKYLEALEITTVDNRVYMGLVRVKTKNYTDLKDKTHFEYLQKAIECSNDEVKKSIKQQYSAYYSKRNLTTEQLNIITKEQNTEKKKQVEDHLKTGIPKHYGIKKLNKAFTIIIPVISALIVISAVLLIAIQNDITQTIFSTASFAFIFALIIILTSLSQNKRKIMEYDFILDFYDFLESVSFSDDDFAKILKKLDEFAISYVNNDAYLNIERNFDEFVSVIQDLNDSSVESFLDKYPKLIK